MVGPLFIAWQNEHCIIINYCANFKQFLSNFSETEIDHNFIS